MLIPCPFHILTGYDCPFCGGQRMFLALFRGEIQEAFLLNPVLFCFLPYLIIIIIGQCWKKAAQWRVYQWCVSNKVVFSVLGIFIAWGIIRNLITIG